MSPLDRSVISGNYILEFRAGSSWGALIATAFSSFPKAPILELIRSNFIGRTIIGSTFDWFDFPSYFLGSSIGWFWLARLKAAAKKSGHFSNNGGV